MGIFCKFKDVQNECHSKDVRICEVRCLNKDLHQMETQE